MKKMIIFLFIVIVLCGINIFPVKNLSFEKIFSGACVEVYFSAKFDTGFDAVGNGAGMIINCGVDDLRFLLNTYKVNGYTIKLEDKKIDEVLHIMDPKLVLYKNNYVYGFLECFGEGIILDGDVVNFQCAIVDSEVNIGVPILLGCY